MFGHKMECVVECLNITKQSPIQHRYKTRQYLPFSYSFDKIRYFATFTLEEFFFFMH